MKVTIRSYELNITGKCKGEAKNNDEAVLYFLNELAIVYSAAAQFELGQGYHGMGEGFNIAANDAFNAVLEKGFYDK